MRNNTLHVSMYVCAVEVYKNVVLLQMWYAATFGLVLYLFASNVSGFGFSHISAQPAMHRVSR